MKDFVSKWNNLYPLDRWYRKKHNIRFNSPEHRECNLVSIYFEFVEDRMYEDAQNNHKKNLSKEKRHKENGWLEESQVKFDESVFKNMDLSIFDDD